MHVKQDVVQHSKPFLGKEEIDAAASVIASGYLAQGPMVNRLEREWCRLTRKQHGAAVGSGLGALRLSLVALGVGKDDRVILPAYSCVALMNAVLAVGGLPILADVIPDRWTLDLDDVRRRFESGVKAIIAVNLFGYPGEISGLTEFNVPVVEDCAHALNLDDVELPFGARGTVNIGSFYATKLVAGGEGGIVASNDSSLIDRVRTARNYGDQEANALHLNDKMTDIEAAIVCAQIAKLGEILSRRQFRAEKYFLMLRDLAAKGSIVLPERAPGRVWYRYVVRLRNHRASEVVVWTAKRGVFVETPVWDLRSSRFWRNDLPASSLAFDRVISLPIYPDLTDAQQELICNTLSECLDEVRA